MSAEPARPAGPRRPCSVDGVMLYPPIFGNGSESTDTPSGCQCSDSHTWQAVPTVEFTKTVADESLGFKEEPTNSSRADCRCLELLELDGHRLVGSVAATCSSRGVFI